MGHIKKKIYLSKKVKKQHEDKVKENPSIMESNFKNIVK